LRDDLGLDEMSDELEFAMDVRESCPASVCLRFERLTGWLNATDEVRCIRDCCVMALLGMLT